MVSMFPFSPPGENMPLLEEIRNDAKERKHKIIINYNTYYKTIVSL